MSILTRSKVTEIFCIADDFYKELEKNAVDFRLSSDSSRPKRNRKCTMSESEIITILICFHMGQFRNFKHYYLSYVSTSLASDFSDLLSYNRFIQIEHRVVIPLLMFIRLIGFGSCTGISFVDSTRLPSAITSVFPPTECSEAWRRSAKVPWDGFTASSSTWSAMTVANC